MTRLVHTSMTVLAVLCGLILASCSENGVINDVVDGGPTCTPLTCAGASAECGVLSDGCGGTLSCGTCGAGERCGTGSDANQCVPICTPMTCTELGAGCGMQGDGCGGSIDCGTCDVAGESCGGGGTPNQCGVGTCEPTTCAALMLECGPVSDGCGTLIECGTCTVAGEACGVEAPNRCDPTCTPTTCAALGAECGTAPDGCGGTLTCPSCPAGEMCGIDGANSCGVMPVDAGPRDAGPSGEMPACDGGMGCLRLLAGALGGAGSADGIGAAARFHSPTGIAVDSSGTIFVVDTGNHTIRRVTAAGVVTTVAGRAGIRGSANGTGAAATFDGPSGIAVGPAGELFVADRFNQQVRRISPAGEASLFAGSPIERPGDTDGTGSAATFSYPSQLAIDASGNLLVGGGLGLRDRIRRVTPTAVVSTLALSRGYTGEGLAMFADGSRAFVSNPYQETILEVNLGTGALTDVAGLGPPGGGPGFRDGTGADARFNAPGGMATNSIDRLFVADGNNHAIRAISYPGRVVTTLAGAPSSGPRFDFGGFADGTGSGARFSYPTGLAFHAGALFVTDAGNHAIRRVDVSSGAVTTIAGSGPVIGSSDGEGTTARFAGPRQLVADSAGNWYLADFGNNAIRRVTPSGSVSTLVARICGADGEPLSIAIDASGNLYVGCWNGTLRRVTPAGVVSDVLTTPEAAGIESLAVDPDGTTLTWSTRGVVRRKAGSAAPVNLFDGSSGARIAVATTGGRTFITVQNRSFGEGALLEVESDGFTRTLVPDIGADSTGSLGQLSASLDGTALFWADPAGHRIQRLALDGSDTVTTVVGATEQVGVVLGPLPGRLNAPTGVAVDPRGRIGIVMGSRFFGGTTGGEAALLIAEP